MKGYPKHLNTREDYEYVRANFPRKKWEKDFKNLLNTEAWYAVGTYDTKEGLAEDATHKVEGSTTTNENGEEVTTYGYYELKDNPLAKIYRIGYTKEEVQAVLDGE